MSGTEPERAEGGLSLLIAPAAVLLGFAAAIFGTLVVDVIGHAFGSPLDHPTPAVDLVSDLVFDLCFVAAALYMAVLRNGFGSLRREGSARIGARQFGYVRIRLRVGLAAVLAAGVGYYVVSYLYGTAFHLKGSDKLPSELGVNHSVAAAAAATVFVCVVAPICEEFFFRGFLFGVLRRLPWRVGRVQLGPWFAAAVVGLLFGLAHTGSANPEYLIPLGLLGFVLCLVRWRTGSLYPCMVLHSLNNALALGVNQMHWGAGVIVAVAAGALAVVFALTLPLSRGGRVVSP